MTDFTRLSDGKYKIDDGFYTYLVQPDKAFVQMCLGAQIVASNRGSEDELERFYETGWRTHEVAQGYKGAWAEHLGLQRMSGLAFAAVRRLLGLSAAELAEALSVNERTVRAWESGRDPIPYRLPRELDALRRAHDIHVQKILDDGEAVLPYDKDAPMYGEFPRSWWLGACARAYGQNPEIVLKWD